MPEFLCVYLYYQLRSFIVARDIQILKQQMVALHYFNLILFPQNVLIFIWFALFILYPSPQWRPTVAYNSMLPSFIWLSLQVRLSVYDLPKIIQKGYKCHQAESSPGLGAGLTRPRPWLKTARYLSGLLSPRGFAPQSVMLFGGILGEIIPGVCRPLTIEGFEGLY